MKKYILIEGCAECERLVSWPGTYKNGGLNFRRILKWWIRSVLAAYWMRIHHSAKFSII